VEIGTST